MTDFFLITLILLPFLGSALLFAIPLKEKKEKVTLLIATLCLLLVIVLGNNLGWKCQHRTQFPLVPSLNIQLSFIVDGLSLFFATIITGIGCLVFQYSTWYFRDQKNLKSYDSSMLFFMGSMLGCVFSNNLILLFIFWEMTALISFILIGFYHEKPAARSSARMILLITASSGFLLLLGLMMIGYDVGTFDWFELTQEGTFIKEHYAWYDWALLCCTIGALGKSAQIPFHFRLPRAMEAPTPVCAYLHSATKVKLGVFLIARLYPVFVESSLWLPLLSGICLTTMVVGAIFSLLSHNLKVILAYTTVSQLGFFIGFYGLGTIEGVSYDFVHILNHSLYKGALFLLAGIIYKATGETDIRRMGSLGKHLPLTAVLFFIAVAAMSGFPGTTGFLSKELILADLVYLGRAHSYGSLALVSVIFASIFKVAFSIRLFMHIFISKANKDVAVKKKPPWQMHLAPGILAILAVVGGVWPGGLENLVNTVTMGDLQGEKPIYLWHGWTVELAISATIILLGASLYKICDHWGWAKLKVPNNLRVERKFDYFLGRVSQCSKKITQITQPQKLNQYLTWSLMVSIGFLGVILWSFPSETLSLNNPIEKKTFIICSMNVLALMGTGGIIGLFLLKSPVKKLVLLTAIGLLISAYWIAYRAPSLALIQLLTETFIFLILFSLIRRFFYHGERQKEVHFNPLRVGIALCFGVFTFLFLNQVQEVWENQRIGSSFLQSTLSLTYGSNIVKAILLYPRVLDTMGMVMIFGAASLGITCLEREKKNRLPLSSKKQRSHLFSQLQSKKDLWKSRLFLWFSFVAAFYFLVRAPNALGGGVIAGLITGMSLMALKMFGSLEKIGSFLLKYSLQILFLGWVFVLLSISLSVLDMWIEKYSFYWKSINLSRSLLLNGGVYLSATGGGLHICSLLTSSDFCLPQAKIKQSLSEEKGVP